VTKEKCDFSGNILIRKDDSVPKKTEVEEKYRRVKRGQQYLKTYLRQNEMGKIPM
jgi:hypothetical protein